MMKSLRYALSFCILLFATGFNAWGQKKNVEPVISEDGTRVLKFEDGTSVRYTLVKTDPTVKPLWTIHGGVVIGYDEMQLLVGGVAGFLLDYQSFQLRGSIDRSYPISLYFDDLESYNDLLRDERQLAGIYSVDVGYKLFSKESVRNVPVTVKEAYGKDKFNNAITTTYYTREALPTSNDVYIEAGFMHMIRSTGRRDHRLAFNQTENNFGGRQYSGQFMTNFQATMIKIGGSYQYNQFAVIEIDDKLTSYSLASRIYAHLLLPIQGVQPLGLYAYEGSGILFNGANEQLEPISESELDQEIQFSNVGFLIGSEVRMSSKGNPLLNVVASLEAGILPGLSNAEGGNFYAGLRFQFGINEPLFKR